MIKNYFSIILLLFFIGFQVFSENSIEGNSRNVVISEFEAPPCDTIGNSCNDGNLNTINDVIDANCNCVGVAIALACEDTEITYRINNSGLREIAVNQITVGEGESVELFANLANYTITGPDGTVVNANTMNDILPSQAGTYTVNTALRRNATIPNVVSVSSQHTTTGNNSISAAFDNDPTTFWHSNYADPISGYPHVLVFDMGAGAVLSGFTYLPRTGSGDGGTNGRIGTYDIYVSNTLGSWGTAVVQNGTFASNDALKTVRFTPRQGRYLRFVAKTPAIATQVWATAAELSVLRGGIATASTEHIANPKSYAVDNNDGTFWHTDYNATSPHHIILDLGIDSNVSGLTYLPRQDTGINGRILRYEIYVSNSLTDWDTAVKTGTWEYPGLTSAAQRVLKTVNFPEKSGRYVRLVALTGEGGFASAAEIKAISPTVNFPCVKTIQINVDKIETYTYTDGTWSPRTPVGVVTANDNITIVSGNVEISNNILFNNLTVEPGASLTVGSGAVLTTKTTTLKSRSNSFSSLIVNGELTGTVNYERWVNQIGTSAGGGNDLISSPVKDALFNSAFTVANLGIIPENPAKKGEFAFAPYNVEVGAYQNFNIGVDYSGVQRIVPGVGYRAATQALSPQTGNTLIFSGSAEKGNVNVAITDATAGKAWNLIGNPYPSYLNFHDFLSANINQLDSRNAYQAIYGYTGRSDSDVGPKWTPWNLATIDDNRLIAPGQGFFVKSQVNGGNIQFTPSMRSAGNSDDFIPNRPTNSKKALSKLVLNSAGKNSETSIYFIEGTTKGMDPGYDASVFTAFKNDFLLFTNLLEDNPSLNIAIQSLPYNDFNNVIVPLGMKVKAGVALTISIDDLSTLPSNINVYLEDTQTKTLTLLNDAAYTFTPTTDINGSGRFNVHYSAKTLSVDDLDSSDNIRIYTTMSPKKLYVKGQLTKSTTAYLYDLQGRLVLSKVLNVNNTENSLDIANLGTGIYVVKVNNDNQVKTQKVLIK